MVNYIADLVMYALDNGKHDVHISWYKDNVHINMFPIKEDKEPLVAEDDGEKPDPKADVKDCSNCKHQKYKGSLTWESNQYNGVSPCYHCVSSVEDGVLGDPSNWRPKENI